jgi:hypothetical protein
MPKRYVVYLLVLAFLGGLAFYGYTKWTEAREKVNLWTLVPEDAVFVMESGHHEQFVRRLKRTQIWESLSGIGYVQRLEENLTLLDSLGGGRKDLYKFLAAKTMLSSVHVVSKTDFDLVFYLPISTVKEHRFVRTLGENLEKSSLFSQTTSEYQGYVITEIKTQNTLQSLSHFTYRNNLILSQSQELLKEIIRKVNRKQLEPLTADFKNIDYLTQDKVYANVFVNYDNLPPFLNLFFKPALQPDLEYLSGLCRNGMLEFRIENNKLALNGFSNPPSLRQPFYQQLAGQKPQPLHLKPYLPNRIAVLLRFGLQNLRILREYRSKAAAGRTETGIVPTDSLLRTFHGEIALGYLQSSRPKIVSEKVLFVQSSDAPKSAAILTDLVKKINLENKTISYKENFGKYTIRMVPVPEFPELLFGKLFRGFAQSYYVELPDHILFADNVPALRNILTDITTGNVWANSEAQQAFLEETQHESNFSVFVNSGNAWEMLNQAVQPEKKEGLLQNELLIRDFSQFALDFSAKDRQFYTRVLFRQPAALATEDHLADTFAIEKAAVFKANLVAGPFAVTNPINRTQEMVVQDSSLALHCITADGKISWTDSLAERISGKVIQAPFGSDGKSKYLFATQTRIHCLDRNGRERENFPFYLPDSLQAEHLTVVDWDRNGNSQLLVDDEAGNLFLFDEAGDLQHGYDPQALEGKLAAPPQVYRVGEKNVLLAVLENGYVYALNESGHTYPGFPFSVRSEVGSPAFGKAGTNLRKSEFTVVSLNGEMVKFNLAGEITKRQQLPNPDRTARFELVPENSGRGFLISRVSQGKVSLFDADSRLLLERKFFTSSKKIVQYFLFGGDKVVYAITETGPHKTYLFDGKAQPLGKGTIENQNPVQLFYNEPANQYNLYKAFGNTLEKVVLQR